VKPGSKMYRQIPSIPITHVYKESCSAIKKESSVILSSTLLLSAITVHPFWPFLDQYPLASDIISNFIYFDDVLAGNHTHQSSVSAIKELRGDLESTGFPLRK